MKRTMLTLLKGFVILIMLFSISSCEYSQERPTIEVEDGRFFFLYVDDGSPYTRFRILVDKETRIQYLVYVKSGTSASGVAMTPLLDKEGNVTYYEGELKGMRYDL